MSIVLPFWRRRLLRPALLLLGLNAAAFAAYTLPRSLTEHSLAARLVQLKAEVERERAATGALRRRAEAMDANTRDTERFYAEVLAGREQTLLPVLRELEAGARELGLEARHASFATQEVKGTPLVRFGITMPVAGSYGRLMAFLGRLERSKHFIVVEQIEFRDAASGNSDLSLTLSAYFVKAGAPAAAEKSHG